MEIDMMVDQHAKSVSAKTEFRKVILKGTTSDGFEVKLTFTVKGETAIELEKLYPLNAIRTITVSEGKQKTL